jgi:hypothetical protein
MPAAARNDNSCWPASRSTQSASRRVNIGANNMRHLFLVLLSAAAVCGFVWATPALAVAAPDANANGNGCMRVDGGPDRSCGRIGRHRQRHREVSTSTDRSASLADSPPRQTGPHSGPRLGCLWGLRRYDDLWCRRAGPSSAHW